MNTLDLLTQPAFTRLAWTLLHFIWQGTLLAGGTAVLLDLLRGRSAQVRYQVCLTSLILMGACPLFTAILSPETWVDTWSPSPRFENGGLMEGADIYSSIPSELTDFEQGDRDESNDPKPLVATFVTVLHSSQPYLLAAWMCGVLMLGIRLLAGLIGIWRLRQGLLELPDALYDRVAVLGGKLAVESVTRVFASEKAREALVVGIWRPLVLLPAAWTLEMPAEMLEAIIAHELAHIRRNDLLVNLLERMVETFLFYHPAVWWLCGRLRQEREICCDELAVAATGRRLAYAQTLETVARLRLADVRPVLAASIRGDTSMKLLARVRSVLRGSATADARRSWPAGLAAILLPIGLWAATWGVLSSTPQIASAEDDDKEATEEKVRDDAEAREEKDREEGEGREEESRDKEKEEGDDKEGNEKEGDREKDRDAKDDDRKEGDDEGQKEKNEEGDESEIAQLTQLVKQLRAEVAEMREQMKMMRGGPGAGFGVNEEQMKKMRAEMEKRNAQGFEGFAQAREKMEKHMRAEMEKRMAEAKERGEDVDELRGKLEKEMRAEMEKRMDQARAKSDEFGQSRAIMEQRMRAELEKRLAEAKERGEDLDEVRGKLEKEMRAEMEKRMNQARAKSDEFSQIREKMEKQMRAEMEKRMAEAKERGDDLDEVRGKLEKEMRARMEERMNEYRKREAAKKLGREGEPREERKEGEDKKREDGDDAPKEEIKEKEER